MLSTMLVEASTKSDSYGRCKVILSKIGFQIYLGQCHILIPAIKSLYTIDLHMPPVIEREKEATF
jgi:hypothetical protein